MYIDERLETWVLIPTLLTSQVTLGKFFTSSPPMKVPLSFEMLLFKFIQNSKSRVPWEEFDNGITRNIVAWNYKNSLSYSSRDQKSKMDLTGPKSRCWQVCVPSGSSGGKYIFCLFHLLEAVHVLCLLPSLPTIYHSNNINNIKSKYFQRVTKRLERR